jgi:hypothetical protein
MKNIFQSIIYSLIGLSTVAWISVVLIVISISNPGPDHAIVSFFDENIIVSEKIENFGFEGFAEVSESFFTRLYFDMNLTLLLFTILMTLIWSVGSHYLNVDAPGKAKLYFIHWAIFTGVYLAIVFGIIWYFTMSSAYSTAEFIGAGGLILIYIISILIYFLSYYVGILVGTARHLRSSVLFANKLPGGF